MLDAKEILKEHERLVAQRRPEEPIWREIAALLRPDDPDIGTDTSRDRTYTELFDSTPLLALDAFVGGFFSQATNPANIWMGLSIDGDPELTKWGPVKDHLWQVNLAILRTASPSRSTFYPEIQGSFADVASFGLGTLFSEDVPGQGFMDKAFPLSEIYIDLDGWGAIDTVHRRFRLTGAQALKRFPDLEAHGRKVQAESSYVFVHCVWPNPAFVPGTRGPRSWRFLSAYVCEDITGFCRHSGYFELPYHVMTWAKRSNRIYPRGIGHTVRPDVNTLNEMERSHIVAGQFAAEPPMAVVEESGLSAADFVPNGLIFGGVTEDGKMIAAPIQRGGELRLSMAQSEQRRTAIREAFYFSQMQLLNRPQMTATEVMGFQQARLEQMGPNLVRIQHSGLAPWVARRYAMLERLGALPPPPPELKNRRLAVEFESPLAKAQKLGTARAVISYSNEVIRLAQLDPSAADKLDIDASLDVLHDAMGPPPNVVRSADAVRQIREARAQAQAAQTELDQSAQAVTIAAQASHAAQAGTLAQERAPAP